jgi:phage shock protein A
MGYFSKMWAVIKGFFIRAGDDLVSGSPESIRATYATAIDEAKRQYKDMEKAVAMLASEREKTAIAGNKLEEEEKELERKLEGALAMAEQEPDNPSHKEAGARYLERIKEIDAKQEELSQDLDKQTQKVEHYKTRLREFQDQIKNLKREQGELVAEYVSNQQIIQLEDRLKGLGETGVDESLSAIRDKVDSLKAQAKIATEMGEASMESQDRAYEKMGAQRAAEARFDELLKQRTKTKEGQTEKDRELG